MSTRLVYQRRASFGPLHLNFSRSGMGWSVGTKGARWSVSSKGQHYSSVSVPFVPGARWVTYSHTDGRAQSRGFHFNWLNWVIWLVLCLVFWRACS